MMPLQSISANVTQEQQQCVAEEAEERNRSKSYVIREILADRYDLEFEGSRNI